MAVRRLLWLQASGHSPRAVTARDRVRIPSALCGVVGLKPTTGVIPQTILAGRFYNWAYHGPITRTVANNALMLDIMAGPDNADPLSIERAETSYVEASKGDVKGLRVAWSAESRSRPC